MKVSEADLGEIDDYLARDKFLLADLPECYTRFGGQYSARWGLVDVDGLQAGELAFSCLLNLARPSITLLHRQRIIHRTDLVPADESKPNPVGAIRVGAPRIVTGSHMHLWSDSRDHVRLNGFRDLPIRRPTADALRTFEQAFAATCHELHIHPSPDQRSFNLPDQADLF